MSAPAVGRRHQWKRVGWFQGLAVHRCVCRVERVAKVTKIGGEPRSSRDHWEYRRQGEEAWGPDRLPCVMVPEVPV